MPRVVNRNDPRVQRTRQLLLETFNAIVIEKHNIYSISIQEVTTRANVNRATFYAHFEDKYAMVASWMCAKFQRVLASQVPVSATLEKDKLRQLILAVFDFLALGHRQHSPSDRQLEPLFEVALQEELDTYLLMWLKLLPFDNPRPPELLEITAQMVSWAILGPAMQWSLGNRSASAEEMTDRVLTIVIASLSPVVTVT